MSADLNTDVRYIKGIGETRAKSLEKLGITTLGELVSYFPRAYEDRSVIVPIRELIPGESACVLGTVATQPRLSRIRRGLDIVRLAIIDEHDTMAVTYFNQSYMKDQLKVGESYYFYGRVGGKPGAPELTNPVAEKESAAGTLTGRIVPVYRLAAGIPRNFMQRAVRQGLDACGDTLPDPLPKRVVAEHGLARARYAYENIHFPKSPGDLDIARRRFIFEELFVLSCAMAGMKAGRDRKNALSFSLRDPESFFGGLPFRPTSAQRRAVEDAFRDMSGEHPMSRLVQGDVGSGKTVVAAACCWLAAKNGHQAAFMAPTEILAQQHYKTLSEMLEPLGLHVALLTGGMKAAEKRRTQEAISGGLADVVVGTHALLSEKTEFHSLALVVADEQHRFGVQQRAALSQKGKSPHVLVMSATPIPRTLALLIYGELDVSIIDELPPGRKPVRTFAVGEEMRERINAFIRRLVAEGRQVFVICPMVDENEENPQDDVKSVTEYSAWLRKEVFPELRIASLHGKMKPREKAEIMDAFAAGETDLLVSTTVVEVGVDVPNAALIVVENADRFGLSQLHQLRGRVCRGEHESYCVLFSSHGGEVSRQRLEAMCKTNDGFKIAEEDLRLRGPGDFFGSRQHGLPEMRVANFATDVNILNEARQAAQELMAGDPELKDPENAALRLRVRKIVAENEDTLN